MMLIGAGVGGEKREGRDFKMTREMGECRK